MGIDCPAEQTGTSDGESVVDGCNPTGPCRVICGKGCDAGVEEAAVSCVGRLFFNVACTMPASDADGSETAGDGRAGNNVGWNGYMLAASNGKRFGVGMGTGTGPMCTDGAATTGCGAVPVVRPDSREMADGGERAADGSACVDGTWSLEGVSGFTDGLSDDEAAARELGTVGRGLVFAERGAILMGLCLIEGLAARGRGRLAEEHGRVRRDDDDAAGLDDGAAGGSATTGGVGPRGDGESEDEGFGDGESCGATGEVFEDAPVAGSAAETAAGAVGSGAER